MRGIAEHGSRRRGGSSPTVATRIAAPVPNGPAPPSSSPSCQGAIGNVVDSPWGRSDAQVGTRSSTPATSHASRATTDLAGIGLDLIDPWSSSSRPTDGTRAWARCARGPAAGPLAVELLTARLTANSSGPGWTALDLGGAFPLFRGGLVDLAGRCWTLWRWSTRKRSEVRILYAPPPLRPRILPVAVVLTGRSDRKRATRRLARRPRR